MTTNRILPAEQPQREHVRFAEPAIIAVGGLILAAAAEGARRLVRSAFYRGWEHGHAAGVEEGRATYIETEPDQ